MKKLYFSSILIPIIGALTAVLAADPNALVVTASNSTNNQLLVYNSGGQLIQTVSTQGQGGASGNSGGIEAKGSLVAVVNFGSQSVAILERHNNTFQFNQLVPTLSSPLSVAFGTDHLYVLGTTTIESHRMNGGFVSSTADGVATLLKADGSSAQVGVLPNQLIITEKSNMIETINLLPGGAVSGVPSPVQNIPANVDAPFGLITRGNDAYVTIAHADEISLVRKGAILTTTPSVTQHAPCWVALAGSFLFSSNSPSMTISRYAVFGQKIVQEVAVAAQFNGAPTDISANAGLLAAIDGNGPVSHLSIFSLDEDGNLTLLQPAATINSPANGIAIVPNED